MAEEDFLTKIFSGGIEGFSAPLIMMILSYVLNEIIRTFGQVQETMNISSNFDPFLFLIAFAILNCLEAFVIGFNDIIYGFSYCCGAAGLIFFISSNQSVFQIIASDSSTIFLTIAIIICGMILKIWAIFRNQSGYNNYDYGY